MTQAEIDSWLDGGAGKQGGTVTICKNCKFHLALDQASPRADAGYNHLCKARPLPPATDPVTGTQGWRMHNDLGREFVTNRQYPYCRDVNDGNCALFQATT